MAKKDKKKKVEVVEEVVTPEEVVDTGENENGTTDEAPSDIVTLEEVVTEQTEEVSETDAEEQAAEEQPSDEVIEDDVESDEEDEVIDSDKPRFKRKCHQKMYDKVDPEGRAAQVLVKRFAL